MLPVLLLGFGNGELPGDALEQIRMIAPDYEFVVTDKADEIEKYLDRIEIAVRHVPLALLDRAPQIQWYHNWYAGVEWLERFPRIREGGLTVTNASGVHAVSVTEHVLSMMLAFARNLHLNVRAQMRREWRRETNDALFELAGKRLLIVGLGAIGEHFARAAQGLGMEVTGIRRNPDRGSDAVARVYGPEQLHVELANADFVVIILPATPNTKKLFSKREFEAMKKNSFFINVGRGSIVDETALIQALQNGRICGAGIDVFETEPLPPNSPLWDMEQVIITPHTGGYTPEYFRRSWPIFTENLKRFIEGLPLLNVVNKTAGY
jgi:phosphoglycerate dehydrogenase-like enzyme